MKGNRIWTTDKTFGGELVIQTVSRKPRIWSDVNKGSCLDRKGLWEFFVTLRPGMLVKQYRRVKNSTVHNSHTFTTFWRPFLTDLGNSSTGRAQGTISSCFGRTSIIFLPVGGVRNAGSQNGRKSSPVGYKVFPTQYTQYLVYNLLSVRCPWSPFYTYSDRCGTSRARHNQYICLLKKGRNRVKKSEPCLLWKCYYDQTFAPWIVRFRKSSKTLFAVCKYLRWFQSSLRTGSKQGRQKTLGERSEPCIRTSPHQTALGSPRSP